MVKNLSAVQEIWFPDSMKKEMATHSSIFVTWEISRIKETGRLQSMGSQSQI